MTTEQRELQATIASPGFAQIMRVLTKRLAQADTECHNADPRDSVAVARAQARYNTLLEAIQLPVSLISEKGA